MLENYQKHENIGKLYWNFCRPNYVKVPQEENSDEREEVLYVICCTRMNKK
jgi:hypothetical protein